MYVPNELLCTIAGFVAGWAFGYWKYDGRARAQRRRHSGESDVAIRSDDGNLLAVASTRSDAVDDPIGVGSDRHPSSIRQSPAVAMLAVHANLSTASEHMAVETERPADTDSETPSKPQESVQAQLERACREFLATCDRQDMSCARAETWFVERNFTCVSLGTDPDRWHLLLVCATWSPMTGFVVPAVRRSMGGVTLSDYYDLNRYNGLDPLQPHNISTFCRMSVGTRKVTQKGSIDGR